MIRFALGLVFFPLLAGGHARSQSLPAVPFEYRIPKERFIEEASKQVPESVSVDDVKVGNKLIYRYVSLQKIKITGLKPDLTFEGQKLSFTCSPTAGGDLCLQYEHVVIKSEVRTIAKIFGREIKQSVPVEHREWRPRSNPFVLTAGLKGTIGVSIVGEKKLSDKRIELDLQCTESRIEKVDLNTGDGFRGLLNDVIGIGGAVPNSGPLNPLICKNVSRRILVDPFAKESKETRERLSKIIVDKLAVVVEDKEVVIKGEIRPAGN